MSSEFQELGGPRPATGFGLGLAAVGRPGYINLGRGEDLPRERSVEAMQARAHELLDAAYEHGVRYFDAARSYGKAEEFLASWLLAHPDADDVVIGSKWGYTYVADWRVSAQVHEVKEHSVSAYDRQLAETRSVLGGRLNLYQIHSVTPDSPALTDSVLHERLAALAAEGVTIGLSTSGPRQAEAIRAALEVTVGAAPLFGSVQATYNLLEPSAGPALAETHAAGWTVIVKEALANGRLARRDALDQGSGMPMLRKVAKETDASYDAVALAAVAAQPWADVVLSGAATVEQLTSNLAAADVRLTADQLEQLAAMSVAADDYWADRSRLAWT
jgi:aryl-alcohol dehydrogenase-like predicted oxidoreductase